MAAASHLDFAHTTLKSLLDASPRLIITVGHHEKLSHVLATLKQEKIYSAPVVDAHNKVLGLVDVNDIVTYLSSIFMESVGIKRGEGKASIEAFCKHELHREKVQHIRHVFFDTEVEKIINFSRHNRYVTVPIETATLKDLIHNLKDKDLHRVVAVSADGKIVKVFSRSSVVAFLAKHVNDLGPKAQHTIKAANIGTRPVQLVAPNTRTIDAFVMMTEHGFSAVGFVASYGGSSGNLSVKDVQGLLGDQFDKVLLPVQEYVSHVRQESVRDIVPLVQVGEEDTVAKAVQRVAAVGVHRIYISGTDSQTPVAVVALGDLIPYFA